MPVSERSLLSIDQSSTIAATPASLSSPIGKVKVKLKGAASLESNRWRVETECPPGDLAICNISWKTAGLPP